MSYKYSLPVMNATVNPDTRGEYLRLMKAARVERVFLAICDLWTNKEATERNIASLRDNIAYFNENGIDPAIWIGVSVGHGAVLSHESGVTNAKGYTPLVNINGEPVGDTRCPLDENFRNDLSDFIVRLFRETGARLILLDDDYRISQHGSADCCVCENHLALMSSICGEEIKAEEVREKVFASPANKYRAAYLKAMGDSLRMISADIRRKVDAFDPTLRVGICSASCSWGLDGVTALEISEILAGGTIPCLRLTGAPYWAVVGNKSLPTVMEIARMLHSFCKDSGAELMAEGDVYPRPRYVVPAAHLEIYDAVIRACGYDGILKYMMDYSTSPYYDQGYIKHHCRDLPLHEAMGKLFEGKEKAGVKVFTKPCLFEDADFTLAVPSHYSPSPSAGAVLQSCGIPTVYSEESDCVAVFGENARHIPLDMIARGAILDGIAATILKERGVDVGIVGDRSVTEATVSFAKTDDEPTLSIHKGSGRFVTSALSEKAKVLMSSEVNGDKIILVYRYENARGQRFTVFTADVEELHRSQRQSGLINGYAVRKLILSAYEDITGHPLPVTTPETHELYTLCARGEGSLSVGLFNCYADVVLDPTIELEREYSSVRFVGCDGKLDGKRLTLTDIPAFGIVGFELVE